jgi:hypothetical protein
MILGGEARAINTLTFPAVFCRHGPAEQHNPGPSHSSSLTVFLCFGLKPTEPDKLELK